MGSYILLKHLHLTLVVISGLAFSLRGFIRLGLERPLTHPMIKVGPHLIDTLLLISGVGLLLVTQHSIWSWLGAKLILVLAYIVLGISSFRLKNRNQAIVIYLLALLCFLSIVALSMQYAA